MGIFSNLWDGIKSAPGWILDHAADIGPVITAVKAAAGILAADDEHVPRHIDAALQASATSDSDGLDTYQKYFEYNNTQLVNLANNAAQAEQYASLKANPKSTTLVRGSTSSVVDNISGIWRMPIGVDSTGHASASMYGDLSKFLATMDVPPMYTTSTGQTFDLVDQVGSTLFANLDPAPAKGADDSPITTNGFHVDMGNGSSIYCGHSYYLLPLGKSGADNALHSSIGVKYITTEATQLSSRAHRKELSFHKSLVVFPGQWMVSLTLTWSSVSAADGSQKTFQASFTSANPAMAINATQLSGVSQLLKVTAPPASTPAAVRMAVQSSAMGALFAWLSSRSQPPVASAEKSLADGGGFSNVGVDVVVTDASFLTAST